MLPPLCGRFFLFAAAQLAIARFCRSLHSRMMQFTVNLRVRSLTPKEFTARKVRLVRVKGRKAPLKPRRKSAIRDLPRVGTWRKARVYTRGNYHRSGNDNREGTVLWPGRNGFFYAVTNPRAFLRLCGPCNLGLLEIPTRKSSKDLAGFPFSHPRLPQSMTVTLIP